MSIKIALSVPRDRTWDEYPEEFQQFFTEQIDMFLWPPDALKRRDFYTRKAFKYVNDTLEHKVVWLKTPDLCSSDVVLDVFKELTKQAAIHKNLTYKQIAVDLGNLPESVTTKVAEFLDLLPKGEICQLYTLRSFNNGVTTSFGKFTTITV